MRTLICLATLAAVLAAQPVPKPPATRKLDVVDHYFGTHVPDPYRWLEDDHSLDTKAWVKAQNEVTFKYLEGIPERQRILARMTKLWDYEKYSAPSKHGKYYVYSYNTGLQNQGVVYLTEKLEEKAGCCSIRTSSARTAPSPSAACASARTASTWPTDSPRAARTWPAGR